MEPLSALAIATSVVQFVDFSSKIVSGSYDLYRSTTGLTSENADLEEVTTTLREMSRTITHPMDRMSSSQHIEQLRVLCQNINHVAQELITALESIKLNKRTKWETCLHALRSVWNEQKISRIQEKLNDFRQQLTLLLVVVLRDEVYSAQKDVKDGMEDMHERFVKYIDENRQWRVDIRQVIQKRHASQAGYGNIPFTPRTIRKLGLQYASNDFLRHLLVSLRFGSIDDRHDHIHNRHHKTYEWIFQETPDLADVPWKNFSQWLKDDSPVYWITGKAGSGKSTLMKYLHNDLRTTTIFSSNRAHPVVEAGFFFWNSGTEMQTSQTGLVRTLLSQILRKCPASAPIAFPEEWEAFSLLGSIEEKEWTWIQLRRAFIRLAKDVSSYKSILLLIDGLDEYTGNHSDLVAFLKELVSLSLPNFKMCTSSRPWTIFEDAFRRTPSLRMQDLTLPDMILYATNKFEESQGFKELKNEHPEFATKLVIEIADKASGVFLWVVLVVKSLLLGLTNGDEIGDLRNRLEALPIDLEDLFQKILNDIEPSYRLQASKLLQLFRACRKPPTILTLAFAESPDLEVVLAFRVGVSINPETHSKIERTRRRLNSRCRGLLEVPESKFNEDSKVSYLHRTVKDFMETEERWKVILGLGPPAYYPHCHLSKSYLMQLKMSRPLWNNSQIFNCMTDCMDHASSIGEPCLDERFRLLEALESRISSMMPKQTWRIAAPVHWPRREGGTGMQASLPRSISNETMPQIASFLHYFTWREGQWYARARVERGLDIRKQPDLMPLQFMAAIALITPSGCLGKEDPIAFISFMLQHGCDPNETFNGETLFLYSSRWLHGSTSLHHTKVKKLHNLLKEYGATVVETKSTENVTLNIKKSRVSPKGNVQVVSDTKSSEQMEPIRTRRRRLFSVRSLFCLSST